MRRRCLSWLMCVAMLCATLSACDGNEAASTTGTPALPSREETSRVTSEPPTSTEGATSVTTETPPVTTEPTTTEPTTTEPTTTEPTTTEPTTTEPTTTEPTTTACPHSFGDWTVDVEPTCHANGQRSRMCTLCRSAEEIETLPPTGEFDVLTEPEVKATCTAAGKTARSYCSECKKTLTPATPLPMLPHEYTEEDVCRACQAPRESLGLEYTLIGENYWVSGIGSCKDRVLAIPATHDGRAVTGIASNAFWNCTAIERVCLSEAIQSIGASAFEGCTSLKEIDLPQAVTRISSYTFAGCTQLCTLDLSHVRTIDSYGLAKTSLTEVVIADGTTLAVGFLKDSAVERVVLGTGITSLPANSFWGCGSLTEVVLPAGLLSISSAAFRESGLRSLTVPSSVINIYSEAFYGCEALETLCLSGARAKLWQAALDGCTSLSLITGWTGVTNRDALPLSLCEGVVEENGLCYGEGILLACDPTTEGTVWLPDGVVEISDGAFAGCASITAVQLPNGLLRIGANAFSGCTLLKKVRIPEGVTSVGTGAFAECTALQYVYVPDTLPTLGAWKLPARNGVVLSFGKSLTAIDAAFLSLSGNAYFAVEFRGDVAEWEALETALKTTLFAHVTVTCEDDVLVRVVEERAIYGSQVSYTLYSDGTLTYRGTGIAPYVNFNGMGYAKRIRRVVLEEGIEGLAENTSGNSPFWGCTNLSELCLSSTVRAVSKRMMRGTPWLEAFDAGDEALYLGDVLVLVPASLEGAFTVPEGTVTIAPYAFYECVSLTAIHLPSTLKEIGTGAFYTCRQLAQMALPEGITVLGQSAFYACDALEELILPSTLETVDSPVTTCASLRRIVVKGATGGSVLGVASYCPALQRVEIEGVSELGINTLYDCDAMETVILRGHLTKVDRSAFWSLPKSCVYVCDDAATAEILREFCGDVRLLSEDADA